MQAYSELVVPMSLGLALTEPRLKRAASTCVTLRGRVLRMKGETIRSNLRTRSAVQCRMNGTCADLAHRLTLSQRRKSARM